jgi:hypothetical protein
MDLKMNLYIQIKNGQPFDDPYLESNLYQIIENFDPNNLPDGWAKFTRVLNPYIHDSLYHEVVLHSYTFDSNTNTCTDLWTKRTLNDEELSSKKDNHELIIMEKFDTLITKATTMIDSFTWDNELNRYNKSVWQIYLMMLNEQKSKFQDSLNSTQPLHIVPLSLPVNDPNNNERWIIAPLPLDQGMTEMPPLDRVTQQYLRSKINNIGVTRL